MSVAKTLALLLTSVALCGCDAAKVPGGGSAATGSGSGSGSRGSAGNQAHEIKDHSDSPTFKSQPVADILIANFEDRSDEYVEARKWFQDAKHKPVKVPRATAEKLVADLYAAGALRVFAADFTKKDDAVLCDSLVAMVSAVDDAARGRVLEVRNQFYKSYLPSVGKPELLKKLLNADAVPAVVVIGMNY